MKHPPLLLLFLLLLLQCCLSFHRFYHSQRNIKLYSKTIRVSNVAELHEKVLQGYKAHELDVRGNLDEMPLDSGVHPVVKLLHERKQALKHGKKLSDGRKLAVSRFLLFLFFRFLFCGFSFSCCCAFSSSRFQLKVVVCVDVFQLVW
jgi:hypothetical protein